MTDGLRMGLRITGTAAVRRASSSCCGAGLDGSAEQGWACRECGQPCDRILGEPEGVTISG